MAGARRRATARRRQRPSRMLEDPATFALVVTMNAINTALRQRGQAIRDWDQRDKVIQKFSVLGGKVYALAPSSRPSEVSTNGDGDEKPGG